MKTVVAAMATLLGVFSVNVQAGSSSIDTLFPLLASQSSVARSAVELINPAALTLSHDYTVKTYFITADSNYKNSFGWYDAAEDPTNAKNLSRIWKEATAKEDSKDRDDDRDEKAKKDDKEDKKSAEKDENGKLKLGQLQSIGRQTAGTNLGFYLTSGEFAKDQQTFYTNDALNSDGVSHVIAGLIPDEGILLLGFSDTYGEKGGGFSDLIVAVDIGVDNAKAMAAGAPEPSEWALMIVGSLTLLVVARRRMSFNDDDGLTLKA